MAYAKFNGQVKCIMGNVKKTNGKKKRKFQVKSLARIESLWVLREGLMSFINSISYIRQSNLLLHFFRT